MGTESSRGHRVVVHKINSAVFEKMQLLGWSKEEILAELEQFPERFSPNVILRPIFQRLLRHWRLARRAKAFFVRRANVANDLALDTLRSAARGQEFIADIAERPDALDWLHSLFNQEH